MATPILNPIVHGQLLIFFGNIPLFNELGLTIGKVAFLIRMAITFRVSILVMALFSYFRPLPEPKVLPVGEEFDMKMTSVIKFWDLQ